MKNRLSTDVLIIGAGLSGLTAALEIISTSNLFVTVIETGPGNSPGVHGFNMPLYPQDSAACFLEDTQKSGHYLSDPDLARKICNDSLTLMPYFEQLGISFNRTASGYEMLRPLGASCPRVISVGNAAGPAILKKVHQRLTANEHYSELSPVRALRLIIENKTAAGAQCYDTKAHEWLSISAKSVILASGGFCGIFRFSTNAHDIGGDGIAMAYEAGASLVDLEFIQFEPCTVVYPEKFRGTGLITTMFYEGAVLRNAEGKRFMLDSDEKGEQVNKDILARCIFNEIQSGRGTEHGGVYFDAAGVGAERLRTVYPAYVNRYKTAGIDITTQPIEIAPAPQTSIGGVKINSYCESSVKGLFACGEVTGGVHGANRIGGNAGLETQVFGRTAGKSAVKYTLEYDDMPPEVQPFTNGNLLMDVKTIRSQFQDTLDSSLNVIRNGKELEKAALELRQLLSTFNPENHCYEEYRLRNDILTGYLAITAALNRTESVGCHVRSDSGCYNEKYNLVLNKGTDDAAVRRVPVGRKE